MLRKLILSLMLALSLSLALAPEAPAAAVQTFTNNAVTTLAAPITSTTATNLTVASSSAFPSLSGGNWFIATLEHLVSGIVTANEIIKVTAVSGGTWTVVRAQEGTSGLTWVAGDTVALLPTAGGLSQFVQASQAQAQGYNFAVDTGTANAYVVNLTPPLTAHVQGLPIRFRIAHGNTGASTFNDGVGTASLTHPNSSALTGGELVVFGYATAMWDGTRFQLVEESATPVIQGPLNNPQTINGSLTLSAPIAFLNLFNSSAAANNGQWFIQTGSNVLNICAYNDILGSPTCGISFSRSGSTITGVDLGGTSQTGTTQATGNNTTNFATTAFVQNALSTSPALGGNPTATTQTYTDNSTRIATTAFVQQNFNNSPFLGGTPTATTAALGTSTTQLATTAFIQAATNALIAGSGGANGSMTLQVNGAPAGQYILKWGFHTPGTNAGAGLETISITGSGGAFPHHMYFAAAFANRSTTVNTGVGTGFVLQSSLSTTQFQAVLDDDVSGNRSGLWFALGD